MELGNCEEHELWISKRPRKIHNAGRLKKRPGKGDVSDRWSDWIGPEGSWDTEKRANKKPVVRNYQNITQRFSHEWWQILECQSLWRWLDHFIPNSILTHTWYAGSTFLYAQRRLAYANVINESHEGGSRSLSNNVREKSARRYKQERSCQFNFFFFFFKRLLSGIFDILHLKIYDFTVWWDENKICWI